MYILLILMLHLKMRSKLSLQVLLRVCKQIQWQFPASLSGVWGDRRADIGALLCVSSCLPHHLHHTCSHQGLFLLHFLISLRILDNHFWLWLECNEGKQNIRFPSLLLRYHVTNGCALRVPARVPEAGEVEPRRWARATLAPPLLGPHPLPQVRLREV